jgi:hypothetical protein
MAEIGWTNAQLPSRGVLYEDKIPDGVVQVRKMGVDEEEKILGSGAGGLERIEIVLRNCTKLPNEFKHEDLLITDRMALLLAFRTVTFGPHYSFNYKCQYCGAMAKANVNILEDFDEKTPESLALDKAKAGDEDWALHEPFEVVLPDENVAVDVRFLRGKDELSLAKRSKRVRMQSNDPGDPSYKYRIALQIVHIDGEELPIGKKELFVRKLTATDSARLRIAVDEIEPGIDLRVYPDCGSCGATNEMVMPFQLEFFRPSSL